MFSYVLEESILEAENVLIKAVLIELNQCMEPCISCFYLNDSGCGHIWATNYS